MAGYVPRALPVAHVPSASDDGATETAVLTLSNVNTPGPNTDVVLSGVITGTAVTAATDIRIRVYRGAFPGGTQVGGIIDETVTAGDNYTVPFIVHDAGVNEAGGSYTVTMQELNATTTGFGIQVTLSGFTY